MPNDIVVASQENSNCIACKLYTTCKRPFMPAERSVNGSVDILFVGEAPGATEDEQGRPFVGDSGKLLRTLVETLNVNVAYTNAVRCRPVDNKTPTSKQIEHCKSFLMEDIAAIKPKIIVPLGNTALKAVTGYTGITNWRGKILQKDDYKIIPTYHPAAMLYKDSSSSSMEDEWLQDLSLAASMISSVEEKAADDVFEYHLINTLEEARSMFAELVSAKYVAFDTEFITTNIFTRGNAVIVASFAIAGKAWALPLAHNQSPLLEHLDELYDMLEEFAKSEVRKIGHNIKIDNITLMSVLGFGLLSISDDTMVLSQVIDSRLDKGLHGLKALASKHLGMFEYDAELTAYIAEHEECDPEKGGNYSNIPLDILWVYAAKDASATFLLRDILKPKLDKKQTSLYEQILVPAISTFSDIEVNGCLFDESVIEEYRNVYETEMSRLLSEMRKFKEVKRLETMLLNKYKEKHPKARKEPNIPFNPNSSDHIRVIIYDYLKFKCIAKTKTGEPSTEADAIDWMEHPFLDLYRLYKLYASANSKYLTKMPDWIRSDGRARAQYNVPGTVTGRTASKKPNLQNIPTPEKQPGTLLESYPIKNVFVNSFPGGCIMAVDYSAMEMRIMATLSKSKNMMKMFNDGKDAHTYVASKLYRIPEEEITKPARYRAKWVNWTMLFGGGATTMVRLYKIPHEEAEELIQGWYAIFPEVPIYGAEQVEFMKDYGYVGSPFGNRRYFPGYDEASVKRQREFEREAMNHPIQGTASNLLVMSLNIISAIMKSHRMRSLIINTVHDSIMFDVCKGELEDLHTLCIDVMENIKVYATEYCPDINLDWLNVPLVADAEIGTHYGSLIKYDEWLTGEKTYA